ncbi:4351_t:CDS:2 [Acaulospora morrowiae]|uniref:4351_t:CDS:1 n=1 Tax=Acaulospora morrowiae TaxID=94023 RepID=A0A9N8ZB47_9GLOM|nr:4351_t:CDS:2 [Acaulospora morrowiae]
MPARKKVSVESSSTSTSVQLPNDTSTSSRNSSSKTPSKTKTSPTINLVFSKKYTYPINRRGADYKKLSKFIAEALRYINTFNYPYEMFYDLDGKEYAFKSSTDDTMKILKDILEGDDGQRVDTVYILAERKVGIQTFFAYNMDFIVFIIFLCNLSWFILVGTQETKMASIVIGVGLGLWLYWKYLR